MNITSLWGKYGIGSFGKEAKEFIDLLKEMFTFICDYRNEVPGASARDCGNYLDMNLPMANWLANRYLNEVLNVIDESRMNYPD